MKRKYASVIRCCLVWGALLTAFSGACLSQTAPSGGSVALTPPAGVLQITLATDKASCSTGDEISFEVTFVNQGSSPVRVLVSRFVDDNLVCQDRAGTGCRYEPGYGYTKLLLKPGAYLGKTLLLKPGEKKTVGGDALIDGKYRLLFGDMSGRPFVRDHQALKEQHKLPADFPDKYISAGKIFLLKKPGSYRFTYVYETTEADKHWRTFAGARTREEASVDWLWIGKTISNTVELFIQ